MSTRADCSKRCVVRYGTLTNGMQHEQVRLPLQGNCSGAHTVIIFSKFWKGTGSEVVVHRTPLVNRFRVKGVMLSSSMA